MNLLIRSKDGHLDLNEVEAEDDVITFVEALEDRLYSGEITLEEAMNLVNDFNATSKEVSIRARVRPAVTFELDHTRTINVIERKLKLLKSLTRGFQS